MRKEKRICFRLTTNRVAGAVLMAISAVNLTIVGVAFDISSSFATPTATGTFLVSTSTVGETIVPTLVSTLTLTQEPSVTPTYTFTSTNTVTQTPSFTPTYTPTPTTTLTFPPGPTPCTLQSSGPVYL